MALLSLILAASAGQAGDDIVVTARRQDWRAVLVMGGSSARCRVVTSTGDAELDRIGCARMTDCFTAAEPRFAALATARLPLAARKRVRTEINRDLTACFRDTHIKIGVMAQGGTQARREEDNAQN